MNVLFTIGHGARSSEALVAILKEAGIETLVDVRAFPVSKRHPQFSRDALAAALQAAAPRRSREHALNPQEELWRED